MAAMLHMIGNAHLDPVWLWRWPEGCAEAISTGWAAVELLDEQPGVIFTRGEAAIYQWIETLDPVLFARIRELVHAGRWAIVNGWWIQPDCNLPAGESFIRQGLYGKAYFRLRFGVEVEVGYNVDSFGHAATLPMLLRHTGYRHYVFMRPMEHERALPGALFDWLAPDGSRVSTFRIPIGYTTGPRDDMAERIARHEAMAVAAGHPFMCFYGVGNHGGGPTRADVAAIRTAQEAGHSVIFSSPAAYFDAVRQVPRPEVRDELQYHAIGCYAAISELKALMRTAEARLAQAEAAAALASWQAAAPYPYEALQQLWRRLLFNQFHDILGGTSIQSATRDAIQSLGAVVQGADEVLYAGVHHLAATVAPGPDPTETAFLVFNLTGEAQQVPIEVEPWLGWTGRDPHRLLDERGQELPYQSLQSAAAMRGLQRILFAPAVPAFGYRLFRFAVGERTATQTTLAVEPYRLQNAHWLLEIDRASGGIARLFDKQAQREVFAGATAHLPLIVDDPSDTWSHGIDRFGVAGAPCAAERVEITEQGPLRAGIRVHATAGGSAVTSTYMLHDDPDLPIEIRVRVDWHQKNQLLRLCYPLALAAPRFRYEIPYGSLERPADGREWPGQRWVVATDAGGYGVAFANDAKYSYAAVGDTFYVTALRSPVYAHHDPYVLEPGIEYAYSDQGEQQFTLRLLAGSGVGLRDGFRLADELTRPPVVTPRGSRRGMGPQRASLLSVSSASSVVTWLKAAEDGADLVLRLLEVEGKDDVVTIMPSGARVALGPYSLATLRLGHDGRVRESDGLESHLLGADATG